jgi:fermentation-respiration switch protein FrsA (DUF1100 family)
MALTTFVGCRPTRPTNPTTTQANRNSALCRTTQVSGPTTGYWARGAHATTITNTSTHTIHHPTVMGQGGEKHPVILWGNGTFVTPECYPVLLSHWASYGFIVAAANTTNAGDGTAMLAGLNYLTTANGEAGNKFFGVVDTANVGSSGHSQGGGGSISTARDARVKSIWPIEGAGGRAALSRTSGLTVLAFAGENDEAVSPAGVTTFYDSLRLPAALAVAAGVDHFMVNNSVFRPASTAWALWHLKGDQTAKAEFVGANCGLCNDPAWTTYRANAALQAL